MQCERCATELEGEIVLEEEAFPLGIVIRMRPTPDRNWINCDSCNALLCCDCCRYPESGYCDQCIKTYQLRPYLIEVGLIRDEDNEGGAAELD